MICRYLRGSQDGRSVHVHNVGVESIHDNLRHQQNGFCVHLGVCWHIDTPFLVERESMKEEVNG